ncbi:MAG: MFS transporter [Sulfuricellaceae bacterium]|nr:MFS transporter [Sulfuricellaceae bacterium]
MGNKSFMAITLLSAIPSKIALTGFLYYTVPLFIKYLGGNQSLAGRGIMAYGLAIIVFSPLVARLVDRGGSRKPYVLLGSFFSGVALLLLYFFDSTLAVIASVTFLGIAHSFSVSSQMILVTELCKEDCNRIGIGTVMGIFRLMERIGNVAGPLIAGTLIAVYGFSGAFLGIGTVIIVSIGLLALYLYQADKPVLEGAL